jgi:hypothetical protein
VVKALAAMDARFGDMVRLIKAWAGARGLNSAMNGTFNSFALSLMVMPHSLVIRCCLHDAACSDRWRPADSCIVVARCRADAISSSPLVFSCFSVPRDRKIKRLMQSWEAWGATEAHEEMSCIADPVPLPAAAAAHSAPAARAI